MKAELSGKPRKWDVTKAVEMRLRGLSYEQIGGALRVHPKTVERALRRLEELFGDHSREAIEFYREKERDFLDALRIESARQIASILRSGELQKQDLRNLTILLGVLFDKSRLLAGEPTSRVEYVVDAIAKAHGAVVEVEAEPEAEETETEAAPPSEQPEKEQR